MKILKNRIFRLVITVVVLTVFFSACNRSDPLEKLPKMPDGNYLESFVPENAWLVFAYAPNSEAQKILAEKHGAKIFQNKSGDFLNFILSPFVKEPLQGAVKLLLEKGDPMILSVNADPTDGKSRIQLSFAVSQREGLEALLQAATQKTSTEILPESGALETGKQSAPEQEVFVTKTSNGYTVEQFSPPIYGKLDDKFFHLASVATASTLLEKNPTASLLANKAFKKRAGKISNEHAGYIYFRNDPKAKFTDALPFFQGGKNIPENFDAFTEIVMEADGIRTLTSATKASSSDPILKNLMKGGPVELDAKIPGNSIALYSESRDLADIIRLQMKAGKENPNVKTLSGEALVQSLEKLERQTGLSLEKDIFPFLTQNFSFLVEDQGLLMPAISLWIDAGKNPAAAKKVLEKLDASLSTFITLLNVSSQGGAQILERTKTQLRGSDAIHIAFYPKKFPTGSSPIPLFEKMKDEQWDVWFGLSSDNLLFISTRSQFPSTVVKDDISYQTLSNRIAGFSDTEWSFFSTAPAVRYIEGLIELGNTSGFMTPGELKTLETVKRFLEPIKGAISGNKKSGSGIESASFIQVGE